MLILYVVIHIPSPQQITSTSVFPEGTVHVFLKIKPVSDPAAFLLAVLHSFTLLLSVCLPLPEQLHCPLHPPHHPSYTTPSFPVLLPNTCCKFIFLIHLPKISDVGSSYWPEEEVPANHPTRSLQTAGLLQPASFLTGFCPFEPSVYNHGSLFLRNSIQVC